MTDAPRSEQELADRLSEPLQATSDALARTPGDIVILGAGGKMGPSLARMATRAAARADGTRPRRVTAVSRFADEVARRMLEDAGIATVSCDLLDRAAVAALPDAPNVIFMAGQKFGTTNAPSRTWMMNVVVPAICAERYASSRIVAFSTGNVYPLVVVNGGGARETDATAPVGEYAQSCVGRERVFEHYSRSGTCVAIVRLNYAVALRYGVLTDIASKVWRGEPVSLTMGHVNVIWQGDANRAALALLPHASSPPCVVNVTGPAALSVRVLAAEFGRRFGRAPIFEGSEAPDALLTNTSRMQSLLGAPAMTIDTMIDWTAAWVRSSMPVLGAETHFSARDGRF